MYFSNLDDDDFFWVISDVIQVSFQISFDEKVTIMKRMVGDESDDGDKIERSLREQFLGIVTILAFVHTRKLVE